MDTYDHLNEAQLREELIKAQERLSELNQNQEKLTHTINEINKGLRGFMTVLYGSPLPVASNAIQDEVRKQVKEQLKGITVDLSSCTIEGEVETYLSSSYIGGDPTLILREES